MSCVAIQIVEGDITRQHADALVNAANSSLLGGGGVDGAIHAAAGPELDHACRELRRTTLPRGLPVGQAVATPAFRLPARWVIHTVAPNRHRGQTEETRLFDCFSACLALAQTLPARTIAFPALGAGAFGWDPIDVAREARKALESDSWTGIERTTFVLFGEIARAAFERELAPLL